MRSTLYVEIVRALEWPHTYMYGRNVSLVATLPTCSLVRYSEKMPKNKRKCHVFLKMFCLSELGHRARQIFAVKVSRNICRRVPEMSRGHFTTFFVHQNQIIQSYEYISFLCENDSYYSTNSVFFVKMLETVQCGFRGEITYPYTTLPTSNLLCHNFERHTVFLPPRSLTGDLDAFLSTTMSSSF